MKKNNYLVPVSPEEQNEMTALALQTMSLPSVNLADPVNVEGNIRAYFRLCNDGGTKPLVTGMALALHIPRAALVQAIAGDYMAVPEMSEQSAEVIRHYYMVLENIWEQLMMNGSLNPASGIFLAKNNFGYKDVVEKVVAKKNIAQPIEIIEAKYDEIPLD